MSQWNHFIDDEGNKGTVSGEDCCGMITQFVLIKNLKVAFGLHVVSTRRSKINRSIIHDVCCICNIFCEALLRLTSLATVPQRMMQWGQY